MRVVKTPKKYYTCEDNNKIFSNITYVERITKPFKNAIFEDRKTKVFKNTTFQVIVTKSFNNTTFEDGITKPFNNTIFEEIITIFHTIHHWNANADSIKGKSFIDSSSLCILPLTWSDSKISLWSPSHKFYSGIFLNKKVLAKDQCWAADDKKFSKQEVMQSLLLCGIGTRWHVRSTKAACLI